MTYIIFIICFIVGYIISWIINGDKKPSVPPAPRCESLTNFSYTSFLSKGTIQVRCCKDIDHDSLHEASLETGNMHAQIVYWK